MKLSTFARIASACATAAMFSVQGATAQTAERDALAIVQGLFDAMRLQDTATMRRAFAPDARLIATGTDPQGQPYARTVAIDSWLRSIGAARAKTDERIYEPEVRVDQDLATVWTRYDFFLGDTFSHCGYDAFQLVRTGGFWKIAQVADTRSNAGQCGRGGVPRTQSKASAADSSAVVASLQRLFDAIGTRDSLAFKDVFIPDGTLIAIGAQGMRAGQAATWASELARGEAQGQMRERMHRPEIRISDNLATIWTWYDFHIGDRFSHCGIDAAQLVRTPAGWKIAQISYTVRTSPCDPPKPDTTGSAG